MVNLIASRSETTSERFGRVIQYRATRTVRGGGELRYVAERHAGMESDYTVSASSGVCGMSGVYRLARLTGGRGIAHRLENYGAHDDALFAVADKVSDPEHARHCTDPASCAAIASYAADVRASVARIKAGA